jgi:hypothetical protein
VIVGDAEDQPLAPVQKTHPITLPMTSSPNSMTQP